MKVKKNVEKKRPSMKTVIKKILDGHEYLVLNEYYIHGARREDIYRHLKVSSKKLGKIHDRALKKVKRYYKEFQNEYKMPKKPVGRLKCANI